jgi:hypothetical protein
MRFFSRLVVFAATTLVSARLQAQPRDWRGPLPIENQRPFQATFLHLPAQNPDVLARNQAQIGVQFDLANHLLIPNPSNGAVVREDFETARAKIEFRRGLGRGLEAAVAVQAFARGGGVLDGPISFYHRLLGLGGDGPDNPQGRDETARGRDILFFQDANGNGVNEDGGYGLGDTSFSLKRQISSGKFASAARFGLKIPTGSSGKIFGSGGFDGAIGLDARLALASNLALFGQVAALKFGGADVPNSDKNGAQGGLGFEYRGRRASIVAQIDAQTRTVTTGNRFADRTPVLASVGYKRDLSRNRRIWASFSENGDYHNFNAPFFGNIGPDFTLSLGFEVRR